MRKRPRAVAPPDRGQGRTTMEIQWFGHSAFRLGADGTNILIDPYFTDNPLCPKDIESSLGRIDHILVTHGHGDHVGDTLRLAKEHGANVVCIAEIAQWLGAQGQEACTAMNKGGTVRVDGCTVSMVHALHSSSLFEDGKPTYLGDCAGFVVGAGRWTVYHAGDTALFSDMALIQRLHRPNVALLPIGGHFTMDAEAAAIACNEFLDVEVVVPMHYRTFPVLAEGPEAFKGLVRRGRVEILEPGQTMVL
jgi:L-ascorbate metabolism protein UlaG (beta-lactamase superfamily)